MTARQLTGILDTYYANYNRFDKPKASALGAASYASRGGQYNVPNTNVYPRDMSLSSVSVANGVKPDAGKPRDLAETVCFKCGRKGIIRAKCISNPKQGNHRSAGYENAKKAGHTFRCSVSAFRPTGEARQSECDQSTGVMHIESPSLAQAGVSVVCASNSGDVCYSTVASLRSAVQASLYRSY